ncbi:chorismate mutase [Candidatus Daviesbacteria bacterium]|nr:chorismate mutase [Candidatus Daviesbacteria bacterium]
MIGILREQIDIIDEKLLKLLAKRISLVEKIGIYKRQKNLPSFDEKRWNQVLNYSLKKAESLKLSKEFVKELMSLIHKYSLKTQKR